MKYITSILSLLCFLCAFPKTSLLAKENADYVIIGVGTAGATMAKLLTDDLSTSVIAIHSGQDLQDLPTIKFSRNALFTVLATLTGIEFSEVGLTPPQQNANDNQMLWALALPEGGASSINAGAWARGTNQVYSQWEAIAGPEWSVDRITAIYKGLENYSGQTTTPAERGFNGPIDIRQIPTPTQFDLKFTQAEIEATGFPFVLDYNDPLTPIGCSSQFQLTQSGPNGAFRVSSATAFLNENVVTPDGQGVGGRKLQIKFGSTALRTIWNGNTAIGVEYINSDGKVCKVYANNGVIVCAGLNSSAFLMHSGVGPQGMLEYLDIPVIYANQNVGAVLADQTIVTTVFLTNPDDTPLCPDTSCVELPESIFNNIDSSSLFVTPNTLISHPTAVALGFVLGNFFGLPNNSIFSQIAWFPAPGGDPTIRQVRIATANVIPGIAFALVDLVQPLSRGNITLNSSNPLDPPLVNSGTFNNPNDLALYVQTFQTYVKDISTALTAIDENYQLVFPSPEILDDTTALTNFIKDVVAPCQCWQSHCRMAPLDQGGVVNSNGQVYGVQNLYVADNSINPVLMDGTTMATGYLVAANIARLLQQ